MKRYFIYKEVQMSNQISMIEQLLNEGAKGWEFVTQAQVINPSRIETGKPNITIVIIYKKELTEQEFNEYEMLKSKGSTKKMN